MNSNQNFKKLQELLEGKTILKIEDPNSGDAICKFVLSDGTAFRLHATELGFWTEEAPNNNGTYNSLTALLEDYSNYVYKIRGNYNSKIWEKYEKIDLDPKDDEWYKLSEPVIKIELDKYKFIYSDGKEFVGELNGLTDYEKLIFNNPKGLKLLATAAEMGNTWVLLFLKSNEDCPEELWFKK
jgi:hypothetical protein